MTSQQIYLMRHCLTFLIVYIGYICLYIALTHFFGRTSWLPLIIIMMLFLYPRYFSFQFFDVKNMAFAGLSMITILTTVKAVEKESIFSCICFGMVAAITTNCRVMGIIYPVMLLGYYLVYDLKKLYDSKGMFHTDLSGTKCKSGNWGVLGKYISTIVSFTLTWYVITPFAWNNPVRSFINTFRGFAHYNQWNGTMVFMGKLITCEEMPWYYLFVWFAISVPIITLLFFIVGNAVTLVRVLKAKQKVKTIVNEDRWPLFFMLIFWGSVFAVIILKSRIYLGWRHLYFVYVPMCVVASYGIKAAYSKWNKKIISCIVAISLLYQVCWITVYHPHESSFFNAVGRLYATQFDREEWRTSAYTALNWIIENEHMPVSVGGEMDAYNSLSEEQKTQVILGEENPTYIINGYRNVIGNEIRYDGYNEVYTITVDGYNVCSVFKKIE